MIEGLQDLVNAQVEVNRAVFAANQERPDRDYIENHITEAIHCLSSSLLKARKKQRKPAAKLLFDADRVLCQAMRATKNALTKEDIRDAQASLDDALTHEGVEP